MKKEEYYYIIVIIVVILLVLSLVFLLPKKNVNSKKVNGSSGPTGITTQTQGDTEYVIPSNVSITYQQIIPTG
jgi:hypothetical protein